MLALVVDDSRAMRMILRRIMSDQGYDVVDAADGQEALDVLEGCAENALPDVALIDWNMPNVNGLELITRIRKNSDWRGITLMMVTTESEYDQIVRALAAGAHEYVIKPFTPDAIVEKLQLLGLVAA